MGATTCQQQPVSHPVAPQLQVQPALGVLQAVALVDHQVVPPHAAEAGRITHQQLVAGQEQLEGRPLTPLHLWSKSLVLA
jgi:peptidase E